MSSAKNRLLVTAFLCDACFNFGRVALPLAVRSMTTANEQGAYQVLALMAGLIMLCVVVGAPLAGKIFDRFGPALGISLGALILAVAHLGFSMAGGLPTLALFGAVLGISGAFFYPAIEGAISADAPHGKLATWLGEYNLTWAASATVGTVLAGVTYERFGAVSFIPVACVAVLVALAVDVAAFRREARGESVPPEPPGDDEVSPVCIERFRRISLVANFSVGALMAVLWALGVTLAAEAVYQGLAWSVLIGSFSLAKLATFVIMSVSTRWHYRMALLVVTQLLAACSAFLLVLFPTLAIEVIAFAVVGVASGVTYFSSIFYSTRSGAADVGGHADRGFKSGLHEAALAAGAAGGLIAAGFSHRLFAMVGLRFERSPFAFAGFLVIFALLLQGLDFRKKRK